MSIRYVDICTKCVAVRVPTTKSARWEVIEFDEYAKKVLCPSCYSTYLAACAGESDYSGVLPIFRYVMECPTPQHSPPHKRPATDAACKVRKET